MKTKSSNANFDFIEKKVGGKKNSNMALLRFRSHGLLLSNNYSQSPTKKIEQEWKYMRCTFHKNILSSSDRTFAC